jgi:haloalkane dehalogenase
MNIVAWEKLREFRKPFLTLWGAKDPVARGIDKRMHAHIPGCEGQPHQRFAEANHFLQEDVPNELVEHTLRFIEATR